MLDLKIKDFLEKTGSSSPTPGGGSVAALVGALSISLSSMVLSLTIGKKNYENVQKEMEDLKIKLDELQENIQGFVQLDIKTFENVMSQYALPKQTDEEKKYRSEMIQKATIEAANVPLSLAKEIFKLYDIIVVLLEKGNKNVYSDALISLILAQAAIESSLCNVIVNKNSIKDEGIRLNLDMQVKQILNNSRLIKDNLLRNSLYFQ